MVQGRTAIFQYHLPYGGVVIHLQACSVGVQYLVSMLDSKRATRSMPLQAFASVLQHWLQYIRWYCRRPQHRQPRVTNRPDIVVQMGNNGVLVRLIAIGLRLVSETDEPQLLRLGKRVSAGSYTQSDYVPTGQWFCSTVAVKMT
jgi:hypothetical protein